MTVMARRKPRRAPPAVALDHGPAIRLARGETAVRDAPDPDAPNRTVRRAAVRVLYHGLWADGLLTDDQHEAADRLLVALEAAQGARDGGLPPGIRVAPHQQGSPSARQVQATADLRLAREALGLVAWEDLVRFVGANLWPMTWAPGALGELRSSLDVLCLAWRITD